MISNFDNDVRKWKQAENYIQSKLERQYFKLENVSNNNLKYDFRITSVLWQDVMKYFSIWETIDVKTNFDIKRNWFFLEVISTASRSEENKNIKRWTIHENWLKIHSFWWSFSDNMKDTDWILFLDKNYSNEELVGKRKGYFVKRDEILKNNREREIKLWIDEFIWNSTEYWNNIIKYSGFIFVPIYNFKPISFTF